MSLVTECIDMSNHSWKELSELDTSLGVGSAKALPIPSFFRIWKLEIFLYHGDRIFQIPSFSLQSPFNVDDCLASEGAHMPTVRLGLTLAIDT